MAEPVALAASLRENPQEQALWAFLHESQLPETAPSQIQLAGNYRVTRAEEGYSFTVTLEQRDDSLFGSYCGMTNNRHDCGMESQGVPDCQIRGLIRGNTGYLGFRSCYSDGLGRASIRKVAAHLEWETTQYPEVETGMMDFCAAPGKSLLKNLAIDRHYDQPARLPQLQFSQPDLTQLIADQDSQRVFWGARVLNDPQGSSWSFELPAGYLVKVLQEADSYVLSQYGDEVFEAPIYKIAYQYYGQRFTGYLNHEDLAQLHFTDDRGNLFMLGFDLADPRRDSDLTWRVLGDAFGLAEQGLRLSVLRENTSSYFPAYELSVTTLPQLTFGDFSFLRVDLTGQGADSTYQSQQLLSWDGQNLTSIVGPSQGRIPFDLKAERSGDQLTLQYGQFAHDPSGGIRTRRFSLQDSLVDISTKPEVSLRCAYLGENNQFTFSDEWEKLSWYGVLQTDTALLIEPVTLTISKEVIEEEMRGSVTHKQISTANGHAYVFLIAGAALGQPGAPGSFAKEELTSQERSALLLAGEDSGWELRSSGRQTDYGPEDIGLYLIGTKDGVRREQELIHQPFREMYYDLRWCGDLDGDGYPDFVVDLAPKGFYTDLRLYLSSRADPEQLVGHAGSFLSDEPGS